MTLHELSVTSWARLSRRAQAVGVDELKWPTAVRPGDQLRVEIEILSARISKSKPGYGIIRIRNVTKNQRDEIVQTFFRERAAAATVVIWL